MLVTSTDRFFCVAGYDISGINKGWWNDGATPDTCAQSCYDTPGCELYVLNTLAGNSCLLRIAAFHGTDGANGPNDVVTQSCLRANTADGNFHCIDGYDVSGYDVASLTAPTAATCASACLKHPLCEFYTLSNVSATGNCLLKASPFHGPDGAASEYSSSVQQSCMRVSDDNAPRKNPPLAPRPPHSPSPGSTPSSAPSARPSPKSSQHHPHRSPPKPCHSQHKPRHRAPPPRRLRSPAFPKPPSPSPLRPTSSSPPLRSPSPPTPPPPQPPSPSSPTSPQPQPPSPALSTPPPHTPLPPRVSSPAPPSPSPSPPPPSPLVDDSPPPPSPAVKSPPPPRPPPRRPPSPTLSPPLSDGSSHSPTLRWSDEFVPCTTSKCMNGGIQKDHWTFDLGDGTAQGLPPGWGNDSLMCYTDDEANIAVIPSPETPGDGVLRVRAKSEPNGVTCRNDPAPASTNSFTSARLKSAGRQSFQWTGPANNSIPVHIEARIKIPLGLGVWPAFWMLPADASRIWCAGGEIDIMEHRRNDQILVNALHFGGNENSMTSSCESRVATNPMTDFESWHRYGVIWSADRIQWLIDGTVVFTVPKEKWRSSLPGAPYAPFDVPFYLILNVAIGGRFPGNTVNLPDAPWDMLVDYVRVWDLNPKR